MVLEGARPAILSADERTPEEWFALGESCLEGIRQWRDYEQAAFCFQRADVLGHPRAAEQLRDMAAGGVGVVLGGHRVAGTAPIQNSDDQVPPAYARPARAELNPDPNRCPSCGATVYRRHPHTDGGFVCAREDGGCGERLYLPIIEPGLRGGLAIQPYKLRMEHATYSYFGRCVHEVKYNKGLSDAARKELMDEAVARVRECGIVENLLGGRGYQGIVVTPAPSSRYRRLQPVHYMAQGIASGRMEYAELLRKRSNVESKDRASGTEIMDGDITCQYAIGGRDILLVDDTYGEGATLRACLRALKDLGAGNVYYLSLCRNTYGGMKGRA